MMQPSEIASGSILVVSPDFPYPANTGGRVDIGGRLRILKQLGYDVDLISTTNSPPEEYIKQARRYVTNLWFCKRQRVLWNFVSLVPFQILTRRGLTDFPLLDKTYDFILLESQRVFCILLNPTLKANTVLLRVHNDEPKYYVGLARSSSSLIEKFFFYAEALKFHTFDKRIFLMTDGFMFVSKDEFEQKRLNLGRPCIFLPPTLSKDKFAEPTLPSKTVLFLGSLFVQNNREAVQWYLKWVHPRITDPAYRLIIAGNSRGQRINWLLRLISDYQNIVLYDAPSELDEIYRQAAVFVNPTRHGAGISTKTIEAICNGLPVVSTIIGVQGTCLVHKEHVLIADDFVQFANYVSFLLQNNEHRISLVKQAQQFLGKHYNHEQKLRELLQGFLSVNTE